MSDSSLWERFKDWITDDYDPHRELKCPTSPPDPKCELWMMEMSRKCRDIALQLEILAENMDDEITKQNILTLACDIRKLEENYVTEYAYIDSEWWDDNE